MSSNAKTVESYKLNPNGYIASRSPEQSQQYSGWLVEGLKPFAKSAAIFEIGTGTGYDADCLESLGYRIIRSDIVDSFIEFNENRGKNIMKFDVVQDDFMDSYGAIVAVNVMQHLDEDEFSVAIQKISHALKPNGRFLFSITKGDGGDEWHDDKGGGRYFLNWDIENLKNVLETAGLRVIYEKEVGYKNWVDIIAEKLR